MSRTIPEEKLTQSIALYFSKYGNVMVEKAGGWAEEHEDYVRATEPVEITFTPLPDEDILKGRVEALDREIEKVRAESTAKITDLKDQKQRLLAITYEESE